MTRVCISVILKKKKVFVICLKSKCYLFGDQTVKALLGLDFDQVRFSFWWVEEQSISELMGLYLLYVMAVPNLASLELIFFYSTGLS